jgi:hypothetical protein
MTIKSAVVVRLNVLAVAPTIPICVFTDAKNFLQRLWITAIAVATIHLQLFLERETGVLIATAHATSRPATAAKGRI